MRFPLAAALWILATPLLPARPRVVAYVPNWINLEEFAKTIDYAKLTHLNLAFENPDDDGRLSFHRRNPALIARARAAGVKVLVSIGGGSASGDEVLKARYFRLMAADRREKFAGEIAAYLKRHGFDGIDVDIEGPSINPDYGGFIAALDRALEPEGKLLTAALSQGYGGSRVPDEALARLDFLNIMAYDATGPWDPDRHGQHSSMEFAKQALAYWLGRGVAKDRAVLGVPFYGYGFGEAYRAGGYAYADVLALYPEAHERDEVGQTIWHNSAPTIRAKAAHVREQQLGGIMIWSLNQDVAGGKSLLKAVHEGLQPPRSK
jgi:GH18 family chitinase